MEVLMITRAEVDRLLQFRSEGYLITSCYFNLDRAKWPPQTLKIRVKDLLQSAGKELAAKAGGHAQRESLHDDFARIEEFVTQEIGTNHHKGLAVFSCSAQKFWQTYPLPRIGRNILIADLAPYIRPLAAILAEYHRYGVVLIDRVMGQVFEVYMGEIVERTDVVAQIPRRVKEGGLGGRDERHIERRHAQAVHQHFQRLADETFALFQRDKFDYLVLGGHRELLREFKEHLHPYLEKRWVGDFDAEPCHTSPAAVLASTLEIEDRTEWENEKRMAEELVQKAGAGQRAVSGIGATLGALTRGEAQTLLVEDGFEMPGFVCYTCHYTSLGDQECPHCRKPLEPCPDIVDEAIELALRKNCQIEHVRGPTALRDAGRMGALLRFQA
jgi:peptide chain release factor subunit 1